MRLRNLTAEHGGLITIFIALTSALLLNTGVLRAEERSPTSAEPALAAALGVQFVEGSSSSLILERDGKQYVVDLATRSIRENDSAVQVASIEPQPTPLTPSGTAQNSGASIFQQQCSSCHGSDGKGSAAGTPDLTNLRARGGIPSSKNRGHDYQRATGWCDDAIVRRPSVGCRHQRRCRLRTDAAWFGRPAERL